MAATEVRGCRSADTARIRGRNNCGVGPLCTHAESQNHATGTHVTFADCTAHRFYVFFSSTLRRAYAQLIQSRKQTQPSGVDRILVLLWTLRFHGPDTATLPRASFRAIVLSFALLTGCDGPFPSADKPSVPADHDVNRRGALHKAGLEHPFTTSAGCSTSDCHQSDLRGGLSVVEEQLYFAPSCYQCHDDKWEEGREGRTPLTAPSPNGTGLLADRQLPVPAAGVGTVSGMRVGNVTFEESRGGGYDSD